MEVIDCHYCEYALTYSPEGWCDCYVEDGCYLDHHVQDSKEEAKKCDFFQFCDVFPKT